jgi:hypothetical protein
MERRYCVLLYSRTWLVPDIVSTIPWDSVVIASSEAEFLRLSNVRRRPHGWGAGRCHGLCTGALSASSVGSLSTAATKQR